MLGQYEVGSGVNWIDMFIRASLLEKLQVMTGHSKRISYGYNLSVSLVVLKSSFAQSSSCVRLIGSAKIGV